MACVVDFFNVDMALHSIKAHKTQYISPLTDARGGPSVSMTVSKYVQSKVPLKKIVLGVPMEGATWKLTGRNGNDNKDIPGVQTPGNMNLGVVCETSTVMMPWSLISKHLKKSTTPKPKEEPLRGSYTMIEDLWVSFESDIDIAEKMAFIKRHKLGGAALLGVNFDTANFEVSRLVDSKLTN
jgi:GH18 family chitinase